MTTPQFKAIDASVALAAVAHTLDEVIASVIEQELCERMEEHEYESVSQLQGSFSQEHCPDPSAFERAQYMHGLSTYRVPPT